MTIKYLKLPIYSVRLADSGGPFWRISLLLRGWRRLHRYPQLDSKPRSTQIIYHRAITSEPVHSLSTDRYIIENLTVCEQKAILVCNANEWIVVYRVAEGGRQLTQAYRFMADFSQKHPNVNALCLSPDASVLMAAGEDQQVRFYELGQSEHSLLHSYGGHNHQIKSVDNNQQDLYVSSDNHLIIICSLSGKEIVRTLHYDQLLPEKTFFRAAYFIKKGSRHLIITHFTPRTATYVTKELLNNKVHTIEVANDQVSQTAFSPSHQLLGVACANGSTSLVDTSSLELQGTQNQLRSGVNACVISKKKFLISGTSNCSYHVQGPEGSLRPPWALLLSLLVTGLFICFSASGGQWEL